MEKKKFSFLSDARALAEIRKHKWIESQKAGREIGFSSAAVDWIKRFGESWKAVHLKKESNYDSIFERRKFRRYRLYSDIILNKNDSSFMARAKELSLVGLLCDSKEYIPVSYEVTIDFKFQLGGKSATHIKCKGAVNRVASVKSGEYEIFLRFDETYQQYIEENLLSFSS